MKNEENHEEQREEQEFKNLQEEKAALTFKQRIQIKTRKESDKKPKMIWIIVVSVLLCAALTASQLLYTKIPAPGIYSAENEYIQMTFLGETMMGRDMQAFIDKNGASSLFKKTKAFWKNSNYVFTNLNCAVLTSKSKEYYEFEKPVHLCTYKSSVKAMVKAGIDVIAYGNDHCYDYGKNAYLSSIKWFEESDYKFSGFFDKTGEVLTNKSQQKNIYTTLRFLHNDRSVGFLSITDKFYNRGISYGVLTTGNPEIYNYVNNSRKENDLTVVYMNWGEEYSATVTDRQTEIAHRLIESGADIVIGSFPKVVQPMEFYKDGVVFYSLGNYITDESNSLARSGIMVQYNEAQDGSSSFEVLPIRINGGVPQPVSAEFYLNSITKTLVSKIPSEKYIIANDGRIIIKFKGGVNG